MLVVLTDAPNGFEPLHLFAIAAFLIISLSIKTWIKRARERRNRRNQEL
jgi:hypothetical protein